MNLFAYFHPSMSSFGLQPLCPINKDSTPAIYYPFTDPANNPRIKNLSTTIVTISVGIAAIIDPDYKPGAKFKFLFAFETAL